MRGSVRCTLDGECIRAVLPDWDHSPRLLLLNKGAKSANVSLQGSRWKGERTGVVCSYGRGKRGQNRGQSKHVVGAFWGQGGHQLRCGQEQDSKSTVAVWVGLPCFCIQGDGMQSPAPLNKFPDDVHSKCGSNEHLSSSESQKRPSKESRLCPHWSADSSIQKDWNVTN